MSSGLNMYMGTQRFFGVESSDSKSLKDQLIDIKDQIKEGSAATIELIIYVVFLAHFVAILVNNQAVADDDQGIVPNRNNITIKSVCAAGIVLCLVRIGWSHVFFKRSVESQSGRVVEMIFSILMVVLFSTALGMALDTRHVLNAVSSTSTSIDVVNASKKHNQYEWILSSIGAGASALYLGFNIYFVVKNKND